MTASVKVDLFEVAEATISGTQAYTNTLTRSEADSLEQSFTLKPGHSVTCQLFVGYYSVGTKYEQWNNTGWSCPSPAAPRCRSTGA